MGLQELRDWYEDLELKRKLEENQQFVVIGLIAVILFCLVMVMCHFMGGGQRSYSNKVKLVYFDLGSQTIKLVDHEYPAVPKSPLEGTTDVFMASVFRCDECPEGMIKDGMTLEDLKAEGMFIGWLQKDDTTAAQDLTAYGEAFLYRDLEKDRWYRPMDRGYEAINNRVLESCTNARICTP